MNTAPVSKPIRTVRRSASRLTRALLLLGAVLSAAAAHTATSETPAAERTLIKEPRYRNSPKYSLMTLGSGSAVQVWMVEDGKRLYVDRNANGNLTDDGPALEPRKVRTLGANSWDFEYALDAIEPSQGGRHPDFVLRRWNYGDPEDSYGLSLSVAGRLPMYAGWFGTFWSTNRETAPVIHFGGPFTPKVIRRTEFVLGEKGERLSLCLVRPGSSPGAVSRLSIDALPAFVVPKLTIEWPTNPGDAPVKTSHPLGERCCYWEFYTTHFEMPRGVVSGKARVLVELPAGQSLVKLATTEILVPVVPAKSPASPP